MNPAPPIPADLLITQRLRMPYLRRHAPEVIATAKAQRWDPAEVLKVLLGEEVKVRDRATRTNRRKAAGFPSGKTFDAWRTESSSIPIGTQNGLRTLEWIHRKSVFRFPDHRGPASRTS